MRESDVEKYLFKRITEAGGVCLKFVSAHAGVPDRIVVHNSQVVFVEVKAPGQEPWSLQALMHRRLRARGARVVVCDSYESVDALYASLEK